MEKLNTIQKRNKLNDVYSVDAHGVGGASHKYLIVKTGAQPSDYAAGYLGFEQSDIMGKIDFQHGPRNNSESEPGVLDTDLLEVVRDRLVAFNKGEFATRENAIAITKIEEALLWMNKRVEDRAERDVLGTNNK